MISPTDERTVNEASAREDWERRIYRRLTDTAHADPSLALAAPTGVRAEPGAGHVRLDWESVSGAAGYLIERTGPDGDARILQHGGSDVPAVPRPPFADTGVDDGDEYTYRVGAVLGADYPVWAWSESVHGHSLDADAGELHVAVDAANVVGQLDRVWRMVGSERLTQLRFGDDGHGNDIGAEFAEALRRAHEDLGVTQVRAHAILHDDNHVVTRGANGSLAFDFTEVDALYDQLLEIGLRPIVELSFMPAAIAQDAQQTVFVYRGIISPPRDWAEWYDVVHELAVHLVARYGIDEVATWAFEVWNEPNLEVFWTGTQQEYLRLYDESARAVKSVDERLRVGGPSTAASEWVETLTAHADDTGVALDFVTTHTYGNLPVDVAPSLHRHGFDGVPVWWTEWGVGSTHFGPIHDGVSGAPFVLSGFAAAQGRLDALAYWVISDHFEELGRPPTLFHNGFGLLSVGNLRKPRYWGVHLAAHLGDDVLASRVEGDGADVLVQAWATKHDNGTIDVLVWNSTINAAVMNGDARLDRRVRLDVTALGAPSYRATLARVDAQHSNVLAGYPDDVEWPDAELWARLRAADRLDEQRLPDVTTNAGTAHFDFALPMPGVARIRLSTVTHSAGTDEESSR
ncbi:MAG: xylan 1,4-beta-xylosidase [Pseudonocardiales bacterium]|jgi:xylan 1,4-beta-xylosidase|nr:xylan 1,4-beta-xylosidase [Pseudonocardiales bacterium]MDT4970217.1 xylan 1,4-beta-xylosidase [Pseudonocardiales bacterium]